MLKTSRLLTVTVPKSVYTQIQRTAKQRKTTVSGLIKQAFERYVDGESEVYSDKEMSRFLEKDAISSKLRKDLDKRLSL